MLFEPQWVDVSPFVLSGTRPVTLLPSGKFNGEFWVPTSSLLEADTEFALSRLGDTVRIPMTAYRTGQRALASIFELGVQIGLAAVVELRKHTSDVPKRVYMVIGHDCTDLSPHEDAFRCYLGIALQTK